MLGNAAARRRTEPFIYNDVVRKVLAVALSVILPVAGVSAPFVHAHPDDHVTAHHDGQTVHAHLAGHHVHRHHSPTGHTVENHDHDRAVSVNAVVAVAVVAFSAPDFVATSLDLPIPTEQAAHRPVEIVHTHDPPAFRSRSPRAPPLSLS